MREILVYLGVGSNQGNSVVNIKRAIDLLIATKRIKLESFSNFYLSPPLGNLPQPNYINAAGSFVTNSSPDELLKQTQSVELQLGRNKARKQWDSRPIDIDILIYDRITINYEYLTIPHPEIKNRSFVLLPLSELKSDIVIPGQGKVSELMDKIALNNCKRINDAQR